MLAGFEGLRALGARQHVIGLLRHQRAHWGPDKINTISQTTFSNAFYWIKIYEFRLRFHWSLLLRFKLTIFQHWFKYWLGADQATSHYLNQWWLVHWHIYASLGLSELIQPCKFQWINTSGFQVFQMLSQSYQWRHGNTFNVTAKTFQTIRSLLYHYC